VSRRLARAAMLAAPLLLWSAQARALCPNCLGQGRSPSATMELVGGFLLLPFVVFYVAFRLIRRATRVS